MGKIVELPSFGPLISEPLQKTTELGRVIQALTLLLPVSTAADYNAAFGQFVQTTGVVTVNLPAPQPSAEGYAIAIQTIDGGPLTTVTPSGIIRGANLAAASYQLNVPGSFSILLCDGTNWNVIAGNFSVVAGPICGVAQKSGSYTFLSPRTEWTPELRSLSGFNDSIGLTPLVGGIMEIPVGWFWEAKVSFTIQLAEDAPTGEIVRWSAGGITTLVPHQDPIIGYAGDQVLLGGTCFGAASVPSARPPNALLIGEVTTGSAITTLLGTPFYPIGIDIAMQGLYSFPCEYIYVIS